ncbi:MAG: SPOR domain-containing protein [Gemmatimonadota bacterium]
MRELDLDDRFWRDALEALRSGGGAPALEARYASYAKTLEDLGRQAREDATLIGVRFEGEGRNARLLAFLSTALLVRAGLRAVFVDLSQDLRWLERLTGLDLKQGLVDHIHYGVPLERCVRDTALPGLAVLTGGTRFLTGSPLEDAPAVRGALDRLKQHFRAVVMALPSNEPVSEAGVLALCDALLTVTAEDKEPTLLGRERMAIRLVGDPRAAHDLAAAAHRFVGPIPSLLAGASATGVDHSPAAAMSPLMRDLPRSRPVSRAARDADEDVAFLSLFEEGGPEAGDESRQLAGFEEIEFPDEERRAAEREWPTRQRRRVIASLGVAAVVLGGMVLGARLLPNLDLPTSVGGPQGSEGPDIDRRPIGFEEGSDGDPAAVVSLEEDSIGKTSAAAGALSENVVETTGRPVPYSLHVGSFQSEESALEAMGRLEREGWTAFIAPIALDEQGSWHRVYAGSFADSTAAGLALRSLLAGGLVTDGAVRTTPLTFLLGIYPTREEAEHRRAELRERGIPAYVSGSGPARVYAGAYATAEESRLLEGSLHAAAENVRLTTRIES